MFIPVWIIILVGLYVFVSFGFISWFVGVAMVALGNTDKEQFIEKE